MTNFRPKLYDSLDCQLVEGSSKLKLSNYGAKVLLAVDV